mmetsp:Transcript_5497/g.13232  ORF Transcript_5497/g.13232 Transcript_5497/m.13232 type:complete len:82 (+) Transcript_5497:413-658(+)
MLHGIGWDCDNINPLSCDPFRPRESPKKAIKANIGYNMEANSPIVLKLGTSKSVRISQAVQKLPTASVASLFIEKAPPKRA